MTTESKDWMPTRYTPSLTGNEDFTTDGDRLLRIVDKYWQERDVEGKFKLDAFQRWIIRHALERYPDDYPNEELAGRLRWRQYVVSMGVQNGKSTLGAIFGVYGLMWHMHAPLVMSLAQSRESAKEIYERISYTVTNVPAFAEVAKPTKVSGVNRTDGPGKYIIKAASEKAIQGLPVTLGIIDELHLLSEALWTQAKKRISAREDGILIGLTTAGDNSSTMLLNIYKELEGLITEPDAENRLGGAIWEAPEGSTLKTKGAVEAANPAVACGRKKVTVVRSDAKDDPWVDQQRYTLNRFVEVFNSWIDMPDWYAVTGKGLLLSEGGPYVYAIDAAENMNYATITMTSKVGDVVKTRMIASLVKPTIDQLLKYCKYLRRKHGASAFVVHKRSLDELAEKLKSQGMDVYSLIDSEFSQACKTTYRLISRKQFESRNEEVLKMQVPRAIRKNYYSGWRLDKSHSSVELDALFSTVMGAYIIETKKIGQVHVF